MEDAMPLGQVAAKLFPLLFNMMGPIGVIPLFAALTQGMEQKTRNAMARRAILLSFLALAAAVFIGSSMLGSWNIGNGSLIFAAGLIVTLSALVPLIWSGGGGAGAGSAGPQQTPGQLAASPLAFPGIVNPRAVGVLIIFVAFFPTLDGKLTVLAVAALMLLLNLFAMRHAQWFMSRIGMTPLLILGAVFGVLQVALGVQMMADGWQAWTASP
jgi:multiple antibiotic resistance protein